MEYIGGLVAKIDGSIENCSVSGLMEINREYNSLVYIGGVAGSSNGNIKNVFNMVDINFYNSPTKYREYYIGGIVGIGQKVYNSGNKGCIRITMQESYAEPNERPRICGVGYAVLVNCYNLGDIYEKMGMLEDIL